MNQLFAQVKGDEEKHCDEDPDIKRTVRNHLFTVEPNPLNVVRANGEFLRTIIMLRLGHMPMVERVVDLWQNGKPMMKNMECFYYNRGGYVLSSLPESAITTDNIPSLTASTKVYTDQVRKKNCP